MSNDPNAYRSLHFSRILKERSDIKQLKIIKAYSKPLNFKTHKDLMISRDAWKHVENLRISPQIVFAHPNVLAAHPKTSLYYRGLALLSRKQVTQAVTDVTNWEEGKRRNVPLNTATKVACFYNGVISSIIVGSAKWSIKDGHRNIIATMGITIDGQFRNRIGDIAEQNVKLMILEWLKIKGFVNADEGVANKDYSLTEDVVMRYGSEPDISFLKNERLIATIEVKGGKDPAAALERLGAMAKSFAETPTGCVNFLVAGVITPEMQARLDQIGVVKEYLLDEMYEGGERWDNFVTELFHHALRIT